MSASSKPLVLLLVSQDEIFARYRRALESSFQVERLQLAPDTIVTVQRRKPDVLVLDYQAGNPSPLQLAYQLRVHPNPKTYTAIVCVGEGPEEAAQGVEVFCSREQAHIQLRALVKNALRIRATLQELSDINRQQRDVSERLRRLSLTDDLTGLYNMRFMSRQIETEWLRAERYEKHLSLLEIDVDHFKEWGNADDPLQISLLLTQIGQEIGDGVRFEIDYAARSGLHTFFVLLPETPRPGAEVVAERLRMRLARLNIQSPSLPRPLTVSIGLAHYDGSLKGSEVRRSSDLIRQVAASLQQAQTLLRNHSTTPLSSPLESAS